MASSKPKPLSFSTTIRNPERIPSFLKCIAPYDGQCLTTETIHKVVKNVIAKKEYRPNYIKNNPSLNSIYKSSNQLFSDDQLEEIMSMAPQKHKEAGFKEGWDSRFDTWYKLIKEFGFIKYAYEKPIQITQTGHMLLDASNENPVNEKKVQTVYLNALMRYQTNNPLRKNSNENAPLPLLLNVIRLFHGDPDEGDAGLHRKELPILICWRNNDPEGVYRYIKAIRSKFGFKASDEYIYEQCLSILGDQNRNYLKMSKICYESVDEYIRKMRMSGLLSLRGNGRFLDINRFEQEAAEYVADNYLNYKKFESEDEYLSYLGSIDTKIVQIENNSTVDFSDIRKRKLYAMASEFDMNHVIEELKKVCERKESKDEVLRYVNSPTRLEFLVSIALVQNFEGLDVNPNYSVDDEGLPTFTATGGCADIECYDSDCDCYFEVTLMCGIQDQIYKEVIPIGRHLRDAIKNRRKESFAVLVAPTIHSDTVDACEWQYVKDQITILPFDIGDFVRVLKSKNKIIQIMENPIKVVNF